MDVEALFERAVAGIMVTEITPIEEAQDEVDTLIEDLSSLGGYSTNIVVFRCY